MARSTRTKSGRVLSPENCPVPLSAAMMAENERRERRGEKPMTRFANCDIRSAELSLSQQPKNAGKSFSGTMRRGIHPDADLVSHGKVPMSFWKNSMARASAVFETPPQAPAPSGAMNRVLPWWPQGANAARHNPTPRKMRGYMEGEIDRGREKMVLRLRGMADGSYAILHGHKVTRRGWDVFQIGRETFSAEDAARIIYASR